MSGTLNSQDQSFVTTTSQDNLSEIADGLLAEQRSGSLATAIYGRQLVADHTFVTQQTQLAAQLSGATLATAPDAMQQAQTAQLQTLSGPAFDQQYLSNEVQSNGQSITDAQTQATSGQSPAIGHLNALLVPFQEQHLQQAQLLQAEQNGTALPTVTQPTAVLGFASAANGPLNAQDQTFIQQATNSGLTEIQAGQLAEQKGSDQAANVFARWMVLDHGVLNATLAPLATAEGVTPSATPDAQSASTLSTLQGLSGSAFDQAYITSEIQGHINTIQAFAQEAASGSDPALVALAQSSIPLLEQHLAAAVQINVAFNLGASDAAAAPTGYLGQLAEAVGNATAQGAVLYAQQLASPNAGNYANFLSGLSSPGSAAGIGTLATFTAPAFGAGTASALLNQNHIGA